MKIPNIYLHSCPKTQNFLKFHKQHKGPSLYYVKVFPGFFEPPINLRKDIFTA